MKLMLLALLAAAASESATAAAPAPGGMAWGSMITILVPALTYLSTFVLGKWVPSTGSKNWLAVVGAGMAAISSLLMHLVAGTLATPDGSGAVRAVIDFIVGLIALLPSAHQIASSNR